MYIDQDQDTWVFYYTITTNVDDTIFCIMCFDLSLHALMESNIASQLSILIGLIYMVNIKESC